MDWKHIPDMDTTTGDDNPFATPKLQPFSKVSMNMPTDEWLCKKLDKLNVILVEGYPSRSSEASRLLIDQFVKPVHSQAKWYGLHTDKEKESIWVIYWYNEAPKLNICYSLITKTFGISSVQLAYLIRFHR